MSRTLTEAKDRIAYLATCPRGWYNGEGEPIHPDIIAAATQLCIDLNKHGLPLPYMYPAIDGGISMEFSDVTEEQTRATSLFLKGHLLVIRYTDAEHLDMLSENWADVQLFNRMANSQSSESSKGVI